VSAAPPEPVATPEPAPEPAPAPRPAPAPEVVAAPAPAPEPAPAHVPVVSSGGSNDPTAPTLIPTSSAAGTHLSGDVPEEARRSLAAVEKRARRLSLLQLTERTCKWPLGDPATDDFYFCGLQSQPGKPYCEDHVAVAFQPMSARRDRSRSR
jgi:GcrA cell cycle regulator